MKALYFFLFTLSCTAIEAQFLNNPSFEGEPMDAVTPAGWNPCNETTTPDIFPGVWGVYLEPSHGKTYVGLITRKDGSVETIGQRLPQTLKGNSCYTITMDLAYARTYAGYNHPSKCKIWLSNHQCIKEKLVVETPLITHNYWKTYSWKIYLPEDYNYIIIEAYYPDGEHYTEGNILIDNIRPIKKCDGA